MWANECWETIYDPPCKVEENAWNQDPDFKPKPWKEFREENWWGGPNKELEELEQECKTTRIIVTDPVTWVNWVYEETTCKPTEIQV